MGVETGTMAAGFQYFANDAGGTLKISGFTASPVKAAGEILRLKFRVQKRVSPLALAIKSAQVNDRDVPCASGRITLEEEGVPSGALGLASFTVNGFQGHRQQPGPAHLHRAGGKGRRAEN